MAVVPRAGALPLSLGGVRIDVGRNDRGDGDGGGNGETVGRRRATGERRTDGRADAPNGGRKEGRADGLAVLTKLRSVAICRSVESGKVERATRGCAKRPENPLTVSSVLGDSDLFSVSCVREEGSIVVIKPDDGVVHVIKGKCEMRRSLNKS